MLEMDIVLWDENGAESRYVLRGCETRAERGGAAKGIRPAPVGP